ncbi:aspartate aminotransferase, partial [Curtobacterium sp. PsM8]|nr:aspartate aminotransferase [Curtobacterium sp. PsM8]
MGSLFDAGLTRTSEKYSVYDSDVLHMCVAEMDCAVADPVGDALVGGFTYGYTGYVGDGRALPEAFGDFGAERGDWAVDPELVRTTT